MNDPLLLHLSGDFGVSFTDLDIPTRPTEKICLILFRIITLPSTNSCISFNIYSKYAKHQVNFANNTETCIQLCQT